MPLKTSKKELLVGGFTIVIIILVIMSAARSLCGGPLLLWERTKSNNAISSMKNHLGLTGNLKISKMYKDGMPTGAIMAEYTYTEKSKNGPVSISDVLEIGMYENKKEEDDDLSNQFISAVNNTYSLQPTYIKFKKSCEDRARKEIERTLSDKLKLVNCSLDQYNNEKLLDSLAKANRSSSDLSKKIFHGYYYLNPYKIFNSSQHVLSYAFVDPTYNELQDYPTDSEIIAARKLIEHDIKQLTPSQLIPGKYLISFIIVKDASKINTEKSQGDTDLGYNSFYGFTIKNNQLLLDSGWGTDKKLATNTVLH